MKLHLVDISAYLIQAWQQEFRNFSNVHIVSADILSVAEDTIVSPANSYGYMDGGIDFQYMNYFGHKIQTIVQEAISKRSGGMLPVGSSILVQTGNKRIPRLIVAPTMEFPETVDPINAYRAMRAILRIADQEEGRIMNIYCPGLATGTGRVDPMDAAIQMASAYADWTKGKDTRIE